ncbi:hypothetical protein GCM10027072_53660 [Streptomyces bullii]
MTRGGAGNMLGVGGMRQKLGRRALRGGGRADRIGGTDPQAQKRELLRRLQQKQREEGREGGLPPGRHDGGARDAEHFSAPAAPTPASCGSRTATTTPGSPRCPPPTARRPSAWANGGPPAPRTGTDRPGATGTDRPGVPRDHRPAPPARPGRTLPGGGGLAHAG